MIGAMVLSPSSYAAFRIICPFVYNNDTLRYNVVIMNEKHIKYPQTYHLPHSLTVTDDDKRLQSDEHFASMREVVVTEKMDGENTSVYPGGFIHAKSLDRSKYDWQDWLKRYVRT